MDTLRCIHTREHFSVVGNLVGLKENVREMFADDVGGGDYMGLYLCQNS